MLSKLPHRTSCGTCCVQIIYESIWWSYFGMQDATAEAWTLVHFQAIAFHLARRTTRKRQVNATSMWSEIQILLTQKRKSQLEHEKNSQLSQHCERNILFAKICFVLLRTLCSSKACTRSPTNAKLLRFFLQYQIPCIEMFVCFVHFIKIWTRIKIFEIGILIEFKIKQGITFGPCAFPFAIFSAFCTLCT